VELIVILFVVFIVVFVGCALRNLYRNAFAQTELLTQIAHALADIQEQGASNGKKTFDMVASIRNEVMKQNQGV